MSILTRSGHANPINREQPRPKADNDRSGFAAQIYIEAHFTGRKSLL
jgi:hypothetical protein